MSSGYHRRSPRVTVVDKRKDLQTRSQIHDNEKCNIAAREAFSSDEDEVNLKRKRKHIKTKSIKDLVADHGHGDNSRSSDKGPALMSSDAVLPERRKLELLLGTLKKRDRHNIFAQPVGPDEVEGYYEFIKEPMDFGTMTMKLYNDLYETLEDFEHDVTLVYENAMTFNSSSTVYYRQARCIRDLATKLFSLLKEDPENFETAVGGMKIRACKRDDPVNQTSKTTNSNGSDEGQYRSIDEDQRNAGKSVKQNESISPSHYLNTEPLLPMENNMQTKHEKEGSKGTWKQFIKNLGSMSENQKLSSDSEAFNTYCAMTPQQLQFQKYGVHNAQSWDAGLFGNQPNGALPCAPSNENISALIELQNRQKVLNYNTLVYNEVLCRTLLSLVSIGGQGAIPMPIPIPWNGMPNSNTFIPYPHLNGNYPSTPRNKDGLAFSSVKDDRITPMVDLTSLCPPKQSIGSSYQDLSGAENSYLNSLGMNFQPVGNPNGTLIQPSQSKGEGASANNVPTSGYFTNLLLQGAHPSLLSDIKAGNGTEKLIQTAPIQGTTSFQEAPRNNFGPLGLRINEEAPSTVQQSPAMAAVGLSSGLNQTPSPSWLNLNLPSTEFQLEAAMGGYGGQVPSLGQPFGWPMQPNFNFPAQEIGGGEGFNAEAAAAAAAGFLTQMMGCHGGAEEQGNAAPAARNYLSNP